MKKSTKWTIGVIVAVLVIAGAYLGTSQFSKGSFPILIVKPNLAVIPNSLRDVLGSSRGGAALDIKNFGGATSGVFLLRQIESPWPRLGGIDDVLYALPPLPAGSSTTIYFKNSWDDIIDIILFIDASKVVNESNESDNIWWLDPTSPRTPL